MKRITNKLLIFSLLTTFFVVSGCLEDEEQWDIKNGGFDAANMYPTNNSFFKGETTSVELSYELFENEGITIGDITGTIYLSSKLGTSDPVDFPVSGSPFTLSSLELFSQHPIGGNILTEDDLLPGDQWIISYSMATTGTPLTPLNISSKSKITFTCKSDLAGTYDAVTTGVEYYGSPFTYNYVTELTALEADGQYNLPDLSGGMEPDIWGNDPVQATLEDICDVITLVDAPYAYAYFIDEAYVEADGTIYIKWRNQYQEWGETWLTPQ